MSNELTAMNQLPVTAARRNLAKYATDTGWLPRIQLVTKGKFVDKGLIKPGHYGVPTADGGILDLGESIDILVWEVRDKALDTTEDPPLAVFDENDEVYQDIVERANGKNSGCMHGPSFLFFERNTAKFYEFFCGNKSARAESTKLGEHLPISEVQAETYGCEPQGPIPCTLRAKYIERPQYSWHAPQVTKCSVPFTNLPPSDAIENEVNKFLNPKTEAAEIVKEGEEDDR
jgi:hypothetical protein